MDTEPCAANPKNPWQCAYVGQDGMYACQEVCRIAESNRALAEFHRKAAEILEVDPDNLVIGFSP